MSIETNRFQALWLDRSTLRVDRYTHVDRSADRQIDIQQRSVIRNSCLPLVDFSQGRQEHRAHLTYAICFSQ